MALVDIGSSAVRFALAHVTPGRSFRLVQEARAQTRLAAGGRRLPRAAVTATVTATRRFLGRVDDGRPLRVVAIATSAVREARDAHRLIDALRGAAGIEVEVLSWEEEARLGAVAVLSSLPVREALVVDLGGGSLQLTLVREGTITPLASLPLGVVRTTRGFLHHDPPAPPELRALRHAVVDHTLGVLPALGPATRLIALGGTVRALARMDLLARGRRPLVHGAIVERGTLAALALRLGALPLGRRRRLAGLKATRADVAVAGAVILAELMALAGRHTLTVCERGVRHGLLIRETFGLDKAL